MKNKRCETCSDTGSLNFMREEPCDCDKLRIAVGEVVPFFLPVKGKVLYHGTVEVITTEELNKIIFCGIRPNSPYVWPVDEDGLIWRPITGIYNAWKKENGR